MVFVPLAFGSGILSAALALSIMPIVEFVFRYTTELKLLELANLNHPALKKLLVEAPGSYHHSIMVGALVEAAEEIGANSLLARVMAYYHDLGKGRNAPYFIENQREGINPHNKLKASMSAMIIKRHVTDGIEIAKRHKLGEPILAGIAQHHGTTLIQYFYRKAQEECEEGQTVTENEFRYPGPKPQTREAGLLMIGDSIEAAVRTLPNPTPARLQGLVNKMINLKFTDGQLDECDLTLKDLHLMAKAFMRILTSIYHKRIEYPDMAASAQGKKEKRMPIDIQNQRSLSKITTKTLKTIVQTICEDLGFNDSELSIVIMDDPGIHELNLTWRAKDKPTDVLSFPQAEEK